MIDIEWLRKICLALPNATEQVQWGHNLVFKVGGKMFAIAPLEPARVCLTFKCSDESFADLTERPDVIPAPYLARARWAAMETPNAIGKEELAGLLRASYCMVAAKLPKKFAAKKAKKRPAISNRRTSGRKEPSARMAKSAKSISMRRK